MKAFELLLTIHRLDMRQGKQILDYAKENNMLLEVIEGHIRRESWYYDVFHTDGRLGYPAAVFRLGGGDIQYLYKIEK